MKVRSLSDAAAVPGFDVPEFLASVGVAKAVHYRPGAAVFTQGDACTHVLYVQAGSIKLSVVSTTGREAVVGLLGPRDFFGEGCLMGLPTRHGSATAILPSEILAIPTQQMATLLHKQPAMSDQFIAYMLTRNGRIESDLIDQLFNSTEKRLARALLLLAGYGAEDGPTGAVPKITQATLAEMIGATRSRVNFFLNKFKKLGFIEYDGERPLTINRSLLNVVLND